jgi:hypothetical protein
MVVILRQGGQDDQGQRRCLGITTKGMYQLVSIDAGHAHIDYDAVRTKLNCPCEAIRAIVGGYDCKATEQSQRFVDEREQILIVIDNKDGLLFTQESHSFACIPSDSNDTPVY